MKKFLVSNEDSSMITDAFFDAISQGVSSHGSVAIKNFGKFEFKHTKRKRFAMDFSTGESKIVDFEKDEIKFYPSENFKNEVKK